MYKHIMGGALNRGPLEIPELGLRTYVLRRVRLHNGCAYRLNNGCAYSCAHACINEYMRIMHAQLIQI